MALPPLSWQTLVWLIHIRQLTRQIVHARNSLVFQYTIEEVRLGKNCWVFRSATLLCWDASAEINGGQCRQCSLVDAIEKANRVLEKIEVVLLLEILDGIYLAQQIGRKPPKAPAPTRRAYHQAATWRSIKQDPEKFHGKGEPLGWLTRL